MEKKVKYQFSIPYEKNGRTFWANTFYDDTDFEGIRNYLIDMEVNDRVTIRKIEYIEKPKDDVAENKLF